MNKKIVTLILAFVLFLPFIATRTFATDLEGFDYERQLLKDLGIEVSFSDDKSVTKAEFVSAVMTVMIEDKSVIWMAESPFQDVAPGSEASGLISFAYSIGIIDGDNYRLFHPDDKIKFNEAIKVLVNALGYGMPAQNSGGYPFGYYSYGQKLGLLKGINSVYGDDLITGSIAAKMVCNALDVEILEKSSFGGERFELKSYSGNTFLAHYRNIIKSEGIITGSPYTRLLDTKGTGDGKIEIDDVVYYNKCERLNDNIGCYIEFYYYEDEHNVQTVLSGRVDKRNNIIEIDSTAIDSYKDRCLYYENESGKIIKEKLSAKSVMIYNGKAMAHYTENTFIFENGSVFLINNDNDDETDVIIVNDYKSFVVHQADAIHMIVYDKYDVQRTIDLSEENDKYISLSGVDGNAVKFTDLTAGTVVSALISADEKYIHAFVSKASVTGDISECSEENGKFYATISEKRYEVEKRIADFGKPFLKPGNGGVFYIDIFGKIAGYNMQNFAIQYGYIMKAKEVKNGVDTDLCVRILTEQNQITVFKLADIVEIDGKPIKMQKSIPEAINTPQIVLFRLNGDGKINYIDTEANPDYESDDTLHSFGSAETGEILSYNTQVGHWTVSSNTKYFMCPVIEEDEKDKNMDDYFFVGNRAACLLSGVVYKAQAFSSSADKYVAEVVRVYPDKEPFIIPKKGQCVVFKSASSVLNDRGETVSKIVVYSTAGDIIYNCINNSLVGDKNVKPGDVIKLALNYRGEVADIQMIFDSGARTLKDPEPTGGYGAAYRRIAGAAYVRDNTTIGILPFSTDMSKATRADPEYLVGSDAIVCEVDTSLLPNNKDYIKKGTMQSIRDYKHFAEYSDVFVSFSTMNPYLIVVYN